MTTPRKPHNPYRPFLRNVHVRRIYMLIVTPVWLVLCVPLIVIKECMDMSKEVFSEVMLAIKDGNSYD